MKSAFLLSKGLLCLCDKQNNTWLLVDNKFLFLCSTRYLTRSLRLLVSYRVKYSRRNSTSTRAHVLWNVNETSNVYMFQTLWQRLTSPSFALLCTRLTYPELTQSLHFSFSIIAHLLYLWINQNRMFSLKNYSQSNWVQNKKQTRSIQPKTIVFRIFCIQKQLLHQGASNLRKSFREPP